MTVSTDQTKTLIGAVTTTTWANKPTSASDGALIFVTDVGSGGSVFQYSAALARWRAFSGAINLASLGATTGNINASETIVLQTLIPAGAWQVNDVIQINPMMSKSGSTDSGNVIMRIGTAGTTGDTQIFTTGAMGPSDLSCGAYYTLKLLSATTVQREGANGRLGTYSGGNSNALTGAVTITDSSVNALYVSVSINSSGATNTVAMQACQIQLITP